MSKHDTSLISLTSALVLMAFVFKQRPSKAGAMRHCCRRHRGRHPAAAWAFGCARDAQDIGKVKGAELSSSSVWDKQRTTSAPPLAWSDTCPGLP